MNDSHSIWRRAESAESVRDLSTDMMRLLRGSLYESKDTGDALLDFYAFANHGTDPLPSTIPILFDRVGDRFAASPLDPHLALMWDRIRRLHQDHPLPPHVKWHCPGLDVVGTELPERPLDTITVCDCQCVCQTQYMMVIIHCGLIPYDEIMTLVRTSLTDICCGCALYEMACCDALTGVDMLPGGVPVIATKLLAMIRDRYIVPLGPVVIEGGRLVNAPPECVMTEQELADFNSQQSEAGS